MKEGTEAEAVLLKIKEHKILTAVVCAVILLVLFLIFSLYQSKYCLMTTYYEIKTDQVKEKIRIVQLTDLHNSEFGKKNEHLVQEVDLQEPDLILITGDILNSDEENTGIAVNLITKLCGIAPVYVSFGNHEIEYENSFGINLTELFEENGAHVLDFAYEDIEIYGQHIRLGGIYGYCLPAKYLKTNEAKKEECDFLEEFQMTDRYTILMSHMPVCWIVNDNLEEWDIDCIFSGHAHGGQIRLPLIGGLYAPDQGFFPGREAGLYYSNDNSSVLVLSRGLGTFDKVPRLNNIPEIVVTDILPEKGK